MGEVMISNEEMEVRTESETERKKEKEENEEEMEETNKKKKMVMRWEKLLPRMVLRVLLVEADDSTRQIIAALLRKCSYKVAAVPDGLKAWEMLKGKPHNIDLILTEVELPSISGYALLTLIMEHEICKNIPVIMMSSQDSVSTVYKCMMRGAADYLVKPIRKNELRNLWQHVWRRQSSLARENGPQEESVGQDTAEATSENNPESNHSSGDVARLQNNKDFEKGSDSQSSCTKPDLEAESAAVGNVREIFLPVWGPFILNDKTRHKDEARMDCGQKVLLHENDAGGSAVAACKDSNQMIVNEDVEPESQRTNAKITYEACDHNYFFVNSSKEAIDFMGASAGHKSSLDNTKSKFDFVPQLDLCLTRRHSSGFEIQVLEDTRTLRHSHASAFTRYSNRPLQSIHTTWASVPNQKEHGAYSEGKFSSNVGGYNSDVPGPPPSTARAIISLANGQTEESEKAISSTQQKVFPVNGVGFNNLCTSYGSMFSPIFCKQQSGASPIPSPSSGSQPEPNCKVNPFRQFNFISNSENLYDGLIQTANDTANRTLQKQDKELDPPEDRGHISPTTDQSATSSFYNGAASHLNMGYGSHSGSNSNVDQVANVRVAAERKNEESTLHNANSHRSIQREAALNKFRLKRKDRCYEKKVRYESRKKLAEQRPRVKGQFVRQAHPSAETDQ
ncbi:two-component response regulator-like APRR5 isoform X2 [Ricinus communis]|uniref:two-component response regulator-like APRR5 isoform X2 n=1 Tax=Ricinus communis TaxID=3988 RepID=UPI00201AF867|nr:two-component response regulator-like APRR5 isoform X2 [Ricinus communis]